jgi:hypothetical protein
LTITASKPNFQRISVAFSFVFPISFSLISAIVTRPYLCAILLILAISLLPSGSNR